MVPEKYLTHIKNLSSRYNEPHLLHELQLQIKSKTAFINEVEQSISISRIIFDKNERLGIHVWIGISLSNDSFRTHFNQFLLLAKVSGAKFIQFETKRKGFERVAPKLGFIISGERDGYTIWKIEV